jgi:hypothetical protein
MIHHSRNDGSIFKRPGGGNFWTLNELLQHFIMIKTLAAGVVGALAGVGISHHQLKYRMMEHRDGT